MLFNRLRFLLDYHQITKNIKLAERAQLTMAVREELANFSRSNTGDVRPINVQVRLSEDALYGKYFRSDGSMDDDQYQSSGNSVSDDIKTEIISGSDDEKVEILVLNDDILNEQKVYCGPGRKMPGESLLKPINQRKIEEFDTDVLVQVVRPEIGISKIEKTPKILIKDPPKPQPAAISLSRMRLSEALFKAKNATQAKPLLKRDKSKSPVNVSAPLTVKCNTTLSSSRSSNGSSNEIEPLKDELDASEMSQEGFLRLFQLCTPAYTEYLMNRRPQRMKRLCTSTERGDFHYGRYDLFEKQFANKRQRQFLYSPPATRAKRRVGSNGSNAQTKETTAAAKKGRGIKSNASSSSSISSNGSNNSSEKVCSTCYKRSK